MYEWIRSTFTHIIRENFGRKTPVLYLATKLQIPSLPSRISVLTIFCLRN